MTTNVSCAKHGLQGVGLVCTHVAHAIDSGAQVGFFWGDDTGRARPDAWCLECEQTMVDLADDSSEAWSFANDEKRLCALCWDEAKQRLYRPR